VSHYLTKILNEITECVNDVSAIELSDDAASALRSLVESTKWKFEDAFCAVWLRDARVFFHLETWEPNPENRSTTQYLMLMLAFQKHNTTTAYKIASAVDPTTASKGKQTSVPRDFIMKMQKAFLDSLYAFLDGLVHLASEETAGETTPSATVAPAVISNDGIALRRPVDISNPDTRLLLVIANFVHLNRSLIPSMMNQIESSFGISVAQERKTLMDVVLELDKTLFEDFVKKKSTPLASLMRQGILDSGIDWNESSRPTEVRGYMYEILMALVETHAQVNSVANILLERTMNALLEELAKEALTCLKQIKRFGMGGMLRATLEIEFMHQTLLQYVAPSASTTFTEIYTTIANAYQRRTGLGQDDLARELDGVKRTLHDSRRATAIEFLCFKPPRKDKDKEKDKNQESEKDRGSSRQNSGGSKGR
jgi:exocyst complex component 2